MEIEEVGSTSFILQIMGGATASTAHRAAALHSTLSPL